MDQLQVGVYLIKFSAQHLDPDFSKKKQVRVGWLRLRVGLKA